MLDSLEQVVEVMHAFIYIYIYIYINMYIEGKEKTG